MSLLASPWALITLGVALVGAVGGSYVKGRSDGRAIEYAERMELEEVARVSREASIQAAAEAIATIKIEHRTIRQEVQREILEKPVYRDCRSGPDGVSLYQRAAGYEAKPASRDELRATGKAH